MMLTAHWYAWAVPTPLSHTATQTCVTAAGRLGGCQFSCLWLSLHCRGPQGPTSSSCHTEVPASPRQVGQSLAAMQACGTAATLQTLFSGSSPFRILKGVRCANWKQAADLLQFAGHRFTNRRLKAVWGCARTPVGICFY